MTLLTRRLTLVGAAGALAGACTPARFVSSITPRDPALELAIDQAYGPLERHKVDVFGPPGTPGKAPIAIFVYGGGWKSGYRKEYIWAGKTLAHEGFVTLVPDYRLAPEVTFPAFVQDIALAVRWAVDNAGRFGGDPNRIVLVGHSAGAYNAAMVALDPRYLKAVGVDRRRIRAFAGLAGPYYFPKIHGPILTAAFTPSAGQAYQVINFASPQAPAAFLAAGSEDSVVVPINTRKLGQALQSKGVETEWRIYPGLSHAGVLLSLSRPRRAQAPVYDDMIGFLKRQVGMTPSRHAAATTAH
ncbi:MAG TPA: alpha/beta hydrolase [Caulobacter sp.]|nr:alpha/beta hydrolase [Caulobacter sp.]